MTIGLAAAGPDAGRAILDALARVERLATGAIGGFVSVAAFDPAGRLVRAEAQRGGARGLLESGRAPRALLEAPRAVLMSSGPDRPDPLAQFTPAREGVGLVTGHRFPNAHGSDGRPLGEAVLDAIERGLDPQAACAEVMAAHPRADAGVIALVPDGRVGSADSARTAAFPDAGAARAVAAEAAVAVLHNAIRPCRALAPLVAEMVIDRLAPPKGVLGTVALAHGVSVRDGRRSRVVVRDGQAIALEIATQWHGEVPWTAGLGPETPVMEEGRVVGHLRADPFLIVQNGCLVSADGRAEIDVPVVCCASSSREPGEPSPGMLPSRP